MKDLSVKPSFVCRRVDAAHEQVEGVLDEARTPQMNPKAQAAA
jgi:hypothetical protein